MSSPSQRRSRHALYIILVVYYQQARRSPWKAQQIPQNVDTIHKVLHVLACALVNKNGFELKMLHFGGTPEADSKF